jgi:hypothetical protein
MFHRSPTGREGFFVPRSQGFTLHPTDKDPSAGTPALGYSRRLPPGGN